MIQLLVSLEPITPQAFKEDLLGSFENTEQVHLRMFESTGDYLADGFKMLLDSDAEYVGLMTDDDTLSRQGLANLAEYVANNQPDSVWTASSRLTDGSHRPLISMNEMSYKKLSRRRFVPVPLFVAKRSVALEAADVAEEFITNLAKLPEEEVSRPDAGDATRVFFLAWRWALLMTGNTKFFGEVCYHRRLYQARLKFESNHYFCKTQDHYIDQFRQTFSV